MPDFSTPLEVVIAFYEARLIAAPSLGIEVANNALVASDFLPTESANKGVAIHVPQTREFVTIGTSARAKRDVITDAMIVTLNFRLEENHRNGRDAAIVLERAIRQRLIDLTNQPVGVDALIRKQVQRGYHPKSRGWYQIVQTFELRRRESFGQ